MKFSVIYIHIDSSFLEKIFLLPSSETNLDVPMRIFFR